MMPTTGLYYKFRVSLEFVTCHVESWESVLYYKITHLAHECSHLTLATMAEPKGSQQESETKPDSGHQHDPSQEEDRPGDVPPSPNPETSHSKVDSTCCNLYPWLDLKVIPEMRPRASLQSN